MLMGLTLAFLSPCNSLNVDAGFGLFFASLHIHKFVEIRGMGSRVDGTGGAEGALAPPSFLDLCSKNFKISKFGQKTFFSI